METDSLALDTHRLHGDKLAMDIVAGFNTIRDGDNILNIALYGIKNCDTMKKARAWLDRHGAAYRFHDYKVEGVDRNQVEKWCKARGWETILNRAGTTFRNLPDADKENLDERKAIELMLKQPSMIKRPVLEIGGTIVVGFKPEVYAEQRGLS